MEKTERSLHYIVCLSVLVALAAIMRFRDLSYQSMWVDELSRAASAFQPTWEEAMARVSSNFENNGGFYRWEVYWIGQLFGTNEFVLRAYSATCGVLLVALVCEIGRVLHSEAAGIASGLILALSVSAIKYSQEFGPYSSGTLVIWLVFGLIILCNSRPFWLDMTIVGLANYAMWLHTHSAAVIILGTNVLLIQAIIRERAESPEETSVGFWGAGSASPTRLWAMINTAFIFRLPGLMGISDDSTHSGWVPGYDFYTSVPKAIDWYFKNIQIIQDLMIPIILASPLLMVASRIARKADWKLQPEWFLWSAGPGFILLLAGYSEIIRPALHERYILFSIPAFCLIFGVVMGRTFEIVGDSGYSGFSRGDGLGITVLICSLLAVQGIQGLHDSEYYSKERKSDFRGMSQYLDNSEFDGNTLIISQPSTAYWNTYLEMMGSEERVDFGRWENEVPDRGYELVNESEGEVVVYAIGHVVSRFEDPAFKSFLEESGYELIEQREFYQGKVFVYGKGDSS